MDDAINNSAKRERLVLPDGIRQIEDLAQLRSFLEIWINRAASAVWNFRRKEDGSFWKNSDAARKAENDSKAPAPHITTTARAYIALQNAHRARGQRAEPAVESWVEFFLLFVGNAHIDLVDKGGIDFEEKGGKNESKKSQVNTFDVAHLADFIQVAEYIGRFERAPQKNYPVVGIAEKQAGEAEQQSILSSNQSALTSDLPGAQKVEAIDGRTAKLTTELREAIVKHLTGAISSATQSTNQAAHCGEVRFDNRPESAHYFATLHALRALHGLGARRPKMCRGLSRAPARSLSSSAFITSVGRHIGRTPCA
jgi:hypothetical protein